MERRNPEISYNIVEGLVNKGTEVVENARKSWEEVYKGMFGDRKNPGLSIHLDHIVSWGTREFEQHKRVVSYGKRTIEDFSPTSALRGEVDMAIEEANRLRNIVEGMITEINNFLEKPELKAGVALTSQTVEEIGIDLDLNRVLVNLGRLFLGRNLRTPLNRELLDETNLREPLNKKLLDELFRSRENARLQIIKNLLDQLIEKLEELRGTWQEEETEYEGDDLREFKKSKSDIPSILGSVNTLNTGLQNAVNELNRIIMIYFYR